MARQERTLKAMEVLPSLRKQGVSFADMAKELGVDQSTLYDVLGEIAEREGVTRKSLLYQPHAPATGYQRIPVYEPVTLTDPAEAMKHFDAVAEEINQLRLVITREIESQKQNSAMIRKEEALWQ